MILELDPRRWRFGKKASSSTPESAHVEAIPRVAKFTPMPPVKSAKEELAEIGPVLGVVPAHVGMTPFDLAKGLVEVPAKAEEDAMNIGALLSLIFKLAIPAVLTVQQVIGDSQSGADKATMAKDALAGATAGALSVLGGENAAYAQLAAGVAQTAIDTAVSFTKLTGHYQEATKAGNALQASLKAAPAAAKAA